MINNPRTLIQDFITALAARYSMELSVEEIDHELLIAPHSPKDLPSGKAAVYVFSLPATCTAPAGPNRALKVGKAGPNSNNRFRYQHYKSGSANSTLAGAIENNPILLSYIGISRFPDNLGNWIRENTDRDNFYVDGLRQDLLGFLEVYLKGRLGPIYEGSLSQNKLPKGTAL